MAMRIASLSLAVLAAEQFGEDVAGGLVIADQLRAEPFGGQEEVDSGRALPAHGVRTGQVEVDLRAPGFLLAAAKKPQVRAPN